MGMKPPYDIRKATDCHCTPGACDCTEARVHAAELTATFNLRWKADMRAIRRWQKAHPGNDLVWPDHADLVVWLLGENDRQRRVLRRSERHAITHTAAKA
jgi:hypothetical protein